MICFKLQDDPLKRPNVVKILQDDFITQGYMPSRLPTSCLTMAPRFDTKLQQIKRGPLQEINKEIATSGNIPSRTQYGRVHFELKEPPQHQSLQYVGSLSKKY